MHDHQQSTMQQPIADRVLDLVARSQRIPRTRITSSSTFDELGIDSLGGIGIMFDLETEFGIAIPSEEIERITSMSELILGVEALLSSGAAASAPSET